MPYEGISDYWHRRLQRGYTANRKRNEDSNPLEDYETDVARYARFSKRKMREHCANLLQVLANPAILESGLEKLDWQSFIRQEYRKDFLDCEGPKWQMLRGLGQEISDGTFQPGKYKKVNIPKIGKSGSRVIEVPPFETRVVARTVTNLLTPILDPYFHLLSIGFRPGRGIHHGLAAASLLFDRGWTHMVCVDIRDAFGSVPLKRVFQVLNKRLHQSPIVQMVLALNGKERSHGLVQGISCSPLLLNVYLDHFLDRWLVNQFGLGNRLVRFADDIAIFCNSPEEATLVYNALAKRLTVIRCSAKESEAEAVRSLGSGETAFWLGFQLSSQSGKLKFSLTDLAWDKLEICLAEAKNKKSLDINLDLEERAENVIASWMYQKAPGIDKAHMGSVLKRLNQLADKYGFSLGSFGLEQAEYIWEQGIARFNGARERLQEWFCLDPHAEKDFVGMI